MTGKILPFRRPEERIHPAMEEVLRVLRESAGGYTRSELAEILSKPANAVGADLSRLSGSTDGFTRRRVWTTRKRKCAVTGRKAPVWEA